MWLDCSSNKGVNMHCYWTSNKLDFFLSVWDCFGPGSHNDRPTLALHVEQWCWGVVETESL